MKRRLTTLAGGDVQHPLALAVYNDGKHYEDRVRFCTSMNNRDYRAYLLKVVNAQALHERREYRTRYKQADIDTAVSELQKAMSQHVHETQVAVIR